MPNTPDARKRILNAAKRAFAEKSFDGARINDIAEFANVPKSLIYYHFESKEKILETLITDFLSEYAKLLRIAENDTDKNKAEKMTDRLQNHYYSFATENIDVIRIIFVESLKKNNKTPVIFKVTEEIVKADKNGNKDINERMVAEFFSGVIPLFSYLCFYDKWCGYFNVERKEFDRLFLGHIAETHGNYHNKKGEYNDAGNVKN